MKDNYVKIVLTIIAIMLFWTVYEFRNYNRYEGLGDSQRILDKKTGKVYFLSNGYQYEHNHIESKKTIKKIKEIDLSK